MLGIIALLAIAVGAGAAGALNMWYDADIDARMARTAARPIPRGRITPDEALTFGTVLSVFSILTLGVLVNWTAGVLLAITIAFYLFVYTMWLKRRTPQNIVIGGAAGAFPPMIGWAAVTGTRQHRQRAAVPRSSSCGRRRTSGRWRSIAARDYERGRRADAAGRRRRRGDAPADPALLAAAGAARLLPCLHRPRRPALRSRLAVLGAGVP